MGLDVTLNVAVAAALAVALTVPALTRESPRGGWERNHNTDDADDVGVVGWRT